MRSTGLRVRPVAGSEIAAAKLSTPICMFAIPDNAVADWMTRLRFGRRCQPFPRASFWETPPSNPERERRIARSNQQNGRRPELAIAHLNRRERSDYQSD